MKRKNFADGGANIDNVNSGGIWDSAINALPGTLKGIADIIGLSKGTIPGTTVYYGDQNKNNTGMYVAIGGVALVVILIMVLALRK